MTQNFTLSSVVVAERKTNTMKLAYISLVLVCVVIETKSERTRSGLCKGCQHGQYTRIKRAKYYSGASSRYYNRPPMTYPIKGAFSFTPPPGYPVDDARQHHNSRFKVSSRPTAERLSDEDMYNIMRFLSKQELDKIVEFSNEKVSPKDSRESYEKPNYIVNSGDKYGSKVMYSDKGPELDNENKFLRHGPLIGAYEGFRPYNPDINELKETEPLTFSEPEPSALFINKNKMALNTQRDADRPMRNQQFSNFNTYGHQEVNENRNGPNIFSDISFMQDEQLPKPSNLREDDFDVSYTNKVLTVVKGDSNSYKTENFGALPLMNYHSKLETVDSYKVPHYTVTSPEKYTPQVSSGTFPVEPAPPASSAHEQSDAHLQATKIWTHKSKGTAYTLHDDGTLSLEKPSRPKTNYSYP